MAKIIWISNLKKSSGFLKEFYQKQSTQETDLTII